MTLILLMAEKIAKKESRQRGYMDYGDVLNFLGKKEKKDYEKKLKTIERGAIYNTTSEQEEQERLSKQRHTLEMALTRKSNLLAPKTKESIYKRLTEIYLKKGRVLEASRYYAHENLAGSEHLISPESMHLQAEFLDQQGYHEEAERIRNSEAEIKGYATQRNLKKMNYALSDLERELNIDLYNKARAKKAVVAPVVAVLGGLFCLSPNLTGNVIGNSSLNSSNLLGITLLLVGIVGALIVVRSKK